jgi:hypothetical protein
MFKSMALNRVLGAMQRLENTMKKRSEKRLDFLGKVGRIQTC